MKITHPTEVGSSLNPNLGSISRRLEGDKQAPAFSYHKTLPSTPKILLIKLVSCHTVLTVLETKKKKKNGKKKMREEERGRERREKGLIFGVEAHLICKKYSYHFPLRFSL